MSLTRRAFLAATGLVMAPTAAHAHHRSGHGKTPSLDVYRDGY